MTYWTMHIISIAFQHCILVWLSCVAFQHWESIRVDGGHWELTRVMESWWGSLRADKGQWEVMEVIESWLGSMRVDGGRWELMKVKKSWWGLIKWMRVEKGWWELVKVDENLWGLIRVHDNGQGLMTHCSDYKKIKTNLLSADFAAGRT